MRFLFTILLLIASLIGYSQKSDSVSLRWNIAQEEKLAYALKLENLKAKFGTLPVEDFFKKFPQKGGKQLKKFEKIYDQFQSKSKKVQFYSELSKRQDETLIILMNKIAPFSENPFGEDIDIDKQRELDKLAGKKSFIEGLINEKGEIYGESLLPQHKSLLSIFFQLPTHTVTEGDTWEVFSNFITVHDPENEIHAEKESSVQVLEITKDKTETVVTLAYEITEYKKMKSPALLARDKNKDDITIGNVVYKAIGKFSVERGRWVSYTGIAITKLEGDMHVSTVEAFSLYEIE